MGVVGWQDLYFLHSMVERCPIHQRHVLANFHVRFRAKFTGPYITWLVKGMGLLERLEGLDIISTPTPFRIETLCSMGMIRKRRS